MDVEDKKFPRTGNTDRFSGFSPIFVQSRGFFAKFRLIGVLRPENTREHLPKTKI